MSDKCEHDEWEDNCPCCLRYEISKLTKQLAERDGEIEQLELQIKQLENGDFYRQLEQQLVEEKKAAGYWMEQSCKDHNRAEKLEQQLSSYQGAVEVEGYVAGVPTDISTELYFASGWSKELGKFNNKKVRVLVMKEVE